MACMKMYKAIGANRWVKRIREHRAKREGPCRKTKGEAHTKRNRKERRRRKRNASTTLVLQSQLCSPFYIPLLVKKQTN
ncbi:hypothetical protein GQ54DRAFT_171398 [Martensiomyces pterosporus]|nr:hypothetical protein GQ54DRAFT_171398 [Martensiomyces pterosporus]